MRCPDFRAAIVLFCWQGLFYVLAGAVSGFITPELLTEISIVGGILILSSGLSILGIRHFKTINLIRSAADSGCVYYA
ncbi:DUF554 family protein [Paenibacillus glucanolyticus]|uniref:DUF554 family protein n=1 Tax=Paenibacillus glucanolyticus TaxID=59843 RepID=UPI0039082A4B